MSGDADGRFPLQEQRQLVASSVHLHKKRPFFLPSPKERFEEESWASSRRVLICAFRAREC